MGDKSAIEWTDSSWNPILGMKGKWSCVKVSPGCTHCYAARLNQRFGGPDYVVGADDLRLDEKVLTEPLRWKKPRKIFACSMTDLFEERVKDEWIERVFDVMIQTDHVFQLLTKRAERMQAWITQWLYPALTEKMLENIWLGVSCEDQPRADERIPWLLKTPTAVRFVSLEPLLGPIDLQRPHGLYYDQAGCNLRKIDWCIVGGESGGPEDRRLVFRHGGPQPCGPWEPTGQGLKWVRSIRDQCVSAGVPFFFKQWGGPSPKSGGRLLDGREWSEYPQ